MVKKKMMPAGPAGLFTLSDACRTGVAEAVTEMKSMGVKTAMLILGNAFDIVKAELLPEDKARIIEEFKKEGKTAMIGDGINDAPALATADIGISMGISGSALAILMSNDVRKVPEVIKLARKAFRKVIENVILSISAKSAVLALAFAGHPLIWAAVLADVGTCLLVIFNSMLLLRGTHKHSAGNCRKLTSTSNQHQLQNIKPKESQCCVSSRCQTSALSGNSVEKLQNIKPKESQCCVSTRCQPSASNCLKLE